MAASDTPTSIARTCSAMLWTDHATLRATWPFARFRADPDRIRIEFMWFWPYEFNRDDLLPLRVTDGGVLVESKRTGTRILLAVPPEDVMPILREWGYATFRESEPAPSPVPPRRRLPDPPL